MKGGRSTTWLQVDTAGTAGEARAVISAKELEHLRSRSAGVTWEVAPEHAEVPDVVGNDVGILIVSEAFSRQLVKLVPRVTPFEVRLVRKASGRAKAAPVAGRFFAISMPVGRDADLLEADAPGLMKLSDPPRVMMSAEVAAALAPLGQPIRGREVDVTAAARRASAKAALIEAINDGGPAALTRLLAGAPVDTAILDAALLHACQRGEREREATLLVESGASVNARDAYGRTPLHHACTNDASAAFVRTLLDAGADPNLNDNDGGGPLAGAGAQPAVVKLILAAGARVDQLGYRNATPLIRYCSEGAPAASVTALLDAGADVNARDAQGLTAAEHAVKAGHPQLATLLLARGARAGAEVQAAASAERYRHIDRYAEALTAWIERATPAPGKSAKKQPTIELSLGNGWTVRALYANGRAIDLAQTPPPAPDLPAADAVGWALGAELLRRAPKLAVALRNEEFRARDVKELATRIAKTAAGKDGAVETLFASAEGKAAFARSASIPTPETYALDDLADRLVEEVVAGVLAKRTTLRAPIESFALSFEVFEALLPSTLEVKAGKTRIELPIALGDTTLPAHSDLLDDVDRLLPAFRTRHRLTAKQLTWEEPGPLRAVLQAELLLATERAAAALRAKKIAFAATCRASLVDDEDQRTYDGDARASEARTLAHTKLADKVYAELGPLLFRSAQRRRAWAKR